MTDSACINAASYGDAPVSQNSTACGLHPRTSRVADLLDPVNMVTSDPCAGAGELEVHPGCRTSQTELPDGLRCPRDEDLPRKEVIQPHASATATLYDFTPVTSPTFDGSLPSGLGHRLRVLLTPMV